MLKNNYLEIFSKFSLQNFLKTSANIIFTYSILKNLGIKEYGTISLYIIVCGILKIIIYGGYESIVFQESIKNIERGNQLLRKGINNRIFILLAITLTILITFVVSSKILTFDKNIFIVFPIIYMSLLLSPFDLLRDYKNGIKEYKTTITSSFILVITTLILCTLSFTIGKNIIIFALIFSIPRLAESSYLIYKYDYINYLIKRFNFELKFDKQFFEDSLPLLFNSLIGIIYISMDQILTNFFFGNEIVGYYSLAYKSPLIFLQIGSIISNISAYKLSSITSKSQFKKLLKEKKKIFLFIFISLVLISSFVSLLFIILISKSYIKYSLLISIFYSLFVGLATISSFLNKIFITNRKSKLLFFKTLLCLISNLIFFFIGIKFFNYYSAVISTVFAEIIGITFLYIELNKNRFFYQGYKN